METSSYRCILLKVYLTGKRDQCTLGWRLSWGFCGTFRSSPIRCVRSSRPQSNPILSNAFQPFKDEASIWPLPSFVRNRLAPLFAHAVGKGTVRACGRNRFADCSMSAKLTEFRAGGQMDGCMMWVELAHSRIGIASHY